MGILISYVLSFFEQCYEGEIYWDQMKLIEEPKNDYVPEVFQDYSSCASDSDCVAVKKGCCACHSGGSSISVNQNMLLAWEEKIAGECSQSGCPAMVSNHVTCFSESRCIKGFCAMIPTKESLCETQLAKSCENVQGENSLIVNPTTGISCYKVNEICK